MNKELQDLAWSVLPKEFKEVVKKEWKRAYYNDTKVILEHLFGKHNLTSDAEEEIELLYVTRQKVMGLYANAKKLHDLYTSATCINTTESQQIDICTGTMSVLTNLFGSKCLPDGLNEYNFAKTEPTQFFESDYSIGDKVIVPISSIGEPRKEVVTLICQYQPQCDYNDYAKQWVIQTKDGQEFQSDEMRFEPYEEPKPAEPKYHVGQKVKFKDKDFGFEITAIEKWDDCDEYKYKLAGWKRSYRESDLEPYAEPKKEESKRLQAESVENLRIASEESHLRNLSKNIVDCDKQLDNILKDSFRNERRLNIAVQILSGIVASSKPCKHPVKRAFELTDALIGECEKGDTK